MQPIYFGSTSGVEPTRAAHFRSDESLPHRRHHVHLISKLVPDPIVLLSLELEELVASRWFT